MKIIYTPKSVIVQRELKLRSKLNVSGKSIGSMPKNLSSISYLKHKWKVSLNNVGGRWCSQLVY